MHKKFVILGLVLLLAGTAMLGWVLVEERKQQQRIANANYESKHDSETGEFLEQYNEWFQSFPEEPTQMPFGLDEYDKGKSETQLWQEQLSEFVLTGSIVCISMGGTIFAWYLLLWLGRRLIRGLSDLKKYLTDVLRRRTKTKGKKQAKTNTEKGEEEQEQEQTPNQQQSRLEKYSKILRNLGKRKPKLNEGQAALSTKSESRSDKRDRKRAKKHLGTYSDDNAEKIAVLLSDEKTVDSIAKLEDSLKAQTELLEERTAQSVQQAILKHSKPLDSTLKDLAQQVSAIREYASCQQERVEKLQDGYDWNIIKTFCLRIIRCIDNLENRISRLSSKGAKTEHLEDIKDELVFALESSGIEQFEPEINSVYRGQEKHAEAVKDKQHCDESKQKGRIAKVIRPGYQYFINEENIKIVRTAQVKLFG